MNIQSIYHIVARLFASAIYFLALATTSWAETTTLRVAYILPNDRPFWLEFQKFIHEVSSDIDISTTVVTANSRFSAVKLMETLAQQKDKPEYVVFHNYRNVGTKMLEIADQAGISSFIINTDISATSKIKIGQPRSQLRSWIGHMFPNDWLVGYQLADKLIELRNTQSSKPHSEKISMIGIGGALSSVAAKNRNQGLQELTSNKQNVKLERLVQTDWRFPPEGTVSLLKHYGDIEVIWTASDPLALQSAEGAIQAGLTPGKDIWIGGIDWSKEGLAAIQEGTLNVSFGGHYMEGGWALILINDFHHGIDFASDLGLVINLPMQAITKENINQYIEVFSDQNIAQIDFRKFSKYYTPSLQRYDFSLQRIIEEYQQSK